MGAVPRRVTRRTSAAPGAAWRVNGPTSLGGGVSGAVTPAGPPTRGGCRSPPRVVGLPRAVSEEGPDRSAQVLGAEQQAGHRGDGVVGRRDPRPHRGGDEPLRRRVRDGGAGGDPAGVVAGGRGEALVRQ